MTMQNRYFGMPILLATAVSSASDYAIQAKSVVDAVFCVEFKMVVNEGKPNR